MSHEKCKLFVVCYGKGRRHASKMMIFGLKSRDFYEGKWKVLDA